MSEPVAEEEKDLVGSQDYISPEAITGIQSKVSFPCDLWSLGVIIWQFYSPENRTPFHAESRSTTFSKILACDYEMPQNEDLTPAARDLISRLLVRDPAARLGAKNIHDLCAHPFFSGFDF